MTQNEIQELLHYSSSTGVFTWLVSAGSVKADVIAGSLNKGYIEIKVKGKRYYAHRLAFLYMAGDMPEFVDHINHQRDDNRWLNLRPATSSINQKNKSMYSCNKSGHTGVSWYKAAKKWRAQICVNEKRISLGCFINLDDAISARQEANLKYNFHSSHGN